VVDRMSGGLHGGHAHGVVLPGGAAKDEHGCPASEASVVAAPGDNSAKSKSALVGMIVHAAVDGIALGAAVREGDSALSLLVFFAIMLHKAPSSFGLASYFLHHGITPEGVKKRLFVFSCAAPLGALCTYMLLSMSLLPYKQVSCKEGGGWGEFFPSILLLRHHYCCIPPLTPRTSSLPLPHPLIPLRKCSLNCCFSRAAPFSTWPRPTFYQRYKQGTVTGMRATPMGGQTGHPLR